MRIIEFWSSYYYEYVNIIVDHKYKNIIVVHKYKNHHENKNHHKYKNHHELTPEGLFVVDVLESADVTNNKMFDQVKLSILP